MNYFHAYKATADVAKTLPNLQRTILERTRTGSFKYHGYDDIEITATLKDVAEAVESAYILTAKTDLPKVTAMPAGYFCIEGDATLRTQGTAPLDYARKRAAAWLAVAKHLEQEEAAKAAEEMKAKAAAADKALREACAKQARLDELADEWFGRDFADLGPNKAAAVTEIHRLETIINEDNPREDAA